jgi:hypothetical protein
MTDFVNFKIKLTQSFEYARRGRVCVRVFIWVSARTCTVFLKKNIEKEGMEEIIKFT